MTYDKESVYDNELNPLIAKVIEICQKEGIPFAMTYGIKEEEDGSMLYCSSWCYGVPPYPDIDVKHFERLTKMIMNPDNEHLTAAITVMKDVLK